jgi:hypothetical protein
MKGIDQIEIDMDTLTHRNDSLILSMVNIEITYNKKKYRTLF